MEKNIEDVNNENITFDKKTENKKNKFLLFSVCTAIIFISSFLGSLLGSNVGNRKKFPSPAIYERNISREQKSNNKIESKPAAKENRNNNDTSKGKQ